jgi:hypothetical protein
MSMIRHLDFLRRAAVTRGQAALCRQRIAGLLDPRRIAMFRQYADELDARADRLRAEAEREAA